MVQKTSARAGASDAIRALMDLAPPMATVVRGGIATQVPTAQVLAGETVVIKPGDTIYVPVDMIGEFCIMGNVNRAGFIGLTGRPMTLKMAIAAAGGLGPLAYPKYCEVVRRLGGDREEIVMVDLDKIASGEQPDFYIKPNDLINVGTHPTSRWRAALLTEDRRRRPNRRSCFSYAAGLRTWICGI